jgi:crotonobetaine/carnitine-CoA ligase
MLSYNYLCNQGRQQNICAPPLPREITWTSLPLFHSSANSYVVVATLIAQAQARLTRRFSVREFWYDIERSGATTAMLMATMFPLLARAPDNEAMLRCRGQLQIVTGVPVTKEMRAIWHDRFGVGHMNSFGYGQTEASKISLLPWGDPLPPLTCAGTPSEDFEVRIAGPDGLALPFDTPGEVLVRPRRPNVMYAGYWNRPAETVAAWRDLWMHTGDIGKLDPDGYLYFVDRQKDYVRSRGENIASVEVENALMVHPDISEVAFHAVPSPNGGEDDLKVTVVPRAGAALTEEDLCHWTIEWLPYFSVPRYIEFRSELPKTPTGRIQKHELRKDGVTPQTWDREGAGIQVRRAPVRSPQADA